MQGRRGDVIIIATWSAPPSPEAATKRPGKASMASFSAWLNPPPPRLALMMWAPGCGILNGGDLIGHRAGTGRVQDFQTHKPDRPSDAGNARAIIALGPDDSRNVGAVPTGLVICRVAVVIHEVPAVHIVDLPIAVIVDAVGGISRVHP
jgi:hypothetical protein